MKGVDFWRLYMKKINVHEFRMLLIAVDQENGCFMREMFFPLRMNDYFPTKHLSKIYENACCSCFFCSPTSSNHNLGKICFMRSYFHEFSSSLLCVGNVNESHTFEMLSLYFLLFLIQN